MTSSNDIGSTGDFPLQVIMRDADLGKRFPDKEFYLSIRNLENPDIEHVDLDGAVAPVHARRLAREKGFEPTHWMEISNKRLNRF